MDITMLRKAMVAVPLTQRPASPAATDAVATELPETQAVNATAESDAATMQSAEKESQLNRAIEALRSVIERRNILDDQTRQVVFQAVNKETGEVVRQIPSEATLRVRAYLKTDDPMDSSITKVA